MKSFFSFFAGAALAAVFAFVFVSRAFACPIPVFRYALEFWEPDPYRVTVYYSGELEPREEEAVARLREMSSGRDMLSNIELTVADVREDDGSLRFRDYDEETMDTPWMVVRYPYIENIATPVWSGRFTPETADLLMESPARSRLAASLAEGKKVWVLVESGNAGRDREAYELLERELARLEQTLVLPDPEQWFVSEGGIPEPEISFEVMRIARDDPREEHLLSMLLNSEKDLGDFESHPMVFPVYGRGIALWAIVGDGINAWNITDAAEFLTGPCSCQVKMLNPGVDLLISKDWSGAVDRVSDETLAARAPATGFEEFERRGEEARKKLEAEEPDAGAEPGRTVHLDIFGETEGAEPAEGPEADEAGEDGSSGAMLPALAAGIAAAVLAAGVVVFKTLSGRNKEV